MPRDPSRDSIYLADIAEAARTIYRWLQEHGHRWHDDEILRNAVLRQLMLVGEAASCLSSEIRDRLPEVKWHEFVDSQSCRARILQS